ncbi:hypothetical protein HMI01_11410 [Halolactibacillus miurensis]|uniref:Glycosyltransferase involved in cell wall bisynthesis n=1 Tax=Halolactibacillus miurensis TaxID=306541 RepID=A0A1I6SQ21_9BACI|nr:glycosyltransferase family 4 protein [Halolactibacillus miurensis]GEM04153.1 hypothetical protein HMI01_11410 [Halolactibacillus miurensis]SFS78898.1 Glycosyltransferase involved in cell wall bisynthesis [Halolactibacillus miurensis]
MKVIHINSDYGNTIYKNLSDELFELGVEQRVFKFVRPNNSLASGYDDYVDVRLNYNNIDRYFFHVKHNKVVKDFFEYLSDKDADILHAHTLFSNGYIAYQTYLRKNIPYIVTVRNTDVNVFFRLMVHLRKIGINILLNAEKIIFISPAHKEMLFNKYIPSKYAEMLIKKTSIIPNGIDEYYFENKNKPKEIDASDELTVLTAAWINKNKNQINVCKAIQILNLKGFNIKYRIVGGVEKHNTYKKLLEELESHSFIKLIPRKNKEELIEEYRQADIFAMVSHKETFGLSYIEALLQCTPIVYTKSQGVDGYFKDGDVGYAAESNSVEDIAEKIEMVIDGYKRLSMNSVVEVDKFKWASISLQYKEIYNSIGSR